MLSKPILLVATADAERSRDFYEHVLGLDFVADAGAALVFDVDGVPLRIQKVNELSPAAYTVLGWSVPDVAAAVATLASRGVAFERYPQMDQDGDGAWTSPAGAKVVWFKDPDGNVLSLTEP